MARSESHAPSTASRLSKRFALFALFAALGACDPNSAADTDGESPETEIISRVELSFVPDDSGDPIVAAFTDPDGDGGVSGSFDPVLLSQGTSYTMSVRFVNELATPAEEITEEIEEEAEEHQIFIFGDSVSGPASASTTALITHSYDDFESEYGDNLEGEDLPVGLRNSIEATTAGVGTLELSLRHLPVLNGTPQKVAGLAGDLADGQALPGEADVRLSFPLTVE